MYKAKISKETLQTIIDYSICASKDETRIYMNSIALRTKGKNLEIAVTDGITLITSLHQCESTGQLDDFILIYRKDIDKIKSFIKENKDIDIFSIQYNKDAKFLIGINYHFYSDESIMLSTILREYPRVNFIIDMKENKEKVDSELSFDINQMVKIRKAFGKGSKELPVTMNIQTGKSAPFIIEAKNNGIKHRAFLMPRRK